MEQYARITTCFCRKFIRTIQGDVKVGDEGTYFSIDKTGHVIHTVKGTVITLEIKNGIKIAIIKNVEEIVTISIDPGQLDLTIIPSNYWR